MLAALLLAGIVAAPLGSAGLFVRARPRARVAGAWAASRRFVLALVGTAVLAAAAAGVLRLLHATEHNLVAGVAGVAVASLIWLPVTRRWSARRAPVLVLQRLPVRRLPGVRAEMDLREPPRPGEHGRRRAALGARGVRGPAVLRLPVGDLRRAGHRGLAAPHHPVPPAARCGGARSPVREPACPGAQRAAGHGHRDAPPPAPAGLSALRGHPDRRQHRRREAVAAGRGMVRPARREVRPPGGLARLQVRRAELRAAGTHRRGRRSDRRGRLRLPDRARIPARLRPGLRRAVGGVHPVLRRTTATGRPRPTTGGCITPTSTSSPSPSRPATSTTGPSSRARWD